MLSEKRIVFSAIILIFLFFLGFSLFINYPALQEHPIFADEAIYYTMSKSLAHDGDLIYTKKDLIRYYRVFPTGPAGIFLKKGKENKIFFAKSFAYSLFAAPFVRIFDYNGFFIFHSLLLLLMLLMGYAYFSLFNKPILSLFSILTFLFASVAIVYFIWIGPDFFNMFLVFTVLFLWLYKHKQHEKYGREESRNTLQAFLQSDWSDYCACFLIGVAVFSKPPNIILAGPLVLHTLVKKKYLKSLLMILVILIASAIFWGTNLVATGDWNYQGGERKTFYENYPFEKESMTFDSTGWKMSSDKYFGEHILPPKFIFYNLFYYFWGRFTGITWYFFPAFLSLILFFFRRRKVYQWFILGALALEILIYITLMPDNYNGGGGALVNRYFLNIYPLFFFLPSLKKGFNEIALSWIVASLFISQILINPYLSSRFPAIHAKKFPFKILPVELTLINNIPTNTDAHAFRQEVGNPPNHGWLHFLDDNFNPRAEPRGFWTKGHHSAEMILKTYYPVKELNFHLLNNPRMRNEVTVKVGGSKKKIVLNRNQRGTLSFSPGKGFQMQSVYLHRITIKASKGSIPFFEIEESEERRFLGVFFELEIIPEK